MSEAGGTHSFDDLLLEVNHPHVHVWDCGGEAVAVTNLLIYPQLREMRIWIAAGSMKAIHATEPHVEAYALSLQCSRLVTTGRPGWVRANAKNGWRPIGVEIIKIV